MAASEIRTRDQVMRRLRARGALRRPLAARHAARNVCRQAPWRTAQDPLGPGLRGRGSRRRFPLSKEVCKLARMRPLFGCGLALALLTLVSSGDTCRLGGKEYPPDVVVCSGGLAVVCQNGSWTNNDGRRCDGPTGSYIGPQRPFAGKNDEPIPEGVVIPQ